MSTKQANIYKGYLPFQSEFSHRFSCWAINHRGWAKMKKHNRKLAKRRIRQKQKKIMCQAEHEQGVGNYADR